MRGELAIRDGRADLISVGRPFISKPDLVDRFSFSQCHYSGVKTELKSIGLF